MQEGRAKRKLSADEITAIVLQWEGIDYSKALK